MIKKTFGLLLFLCLFAQADALYLDFQPLRIGAYVPTSNSGKRLLSHVAPTYQLELSGHFADPWMDIPWKAWINFTWIPSDGRIRHFWKTETHWSSLSMGLTYSWCMTPWSRLYLGLGAPGSYIRIRAETDDFVRRIHKMFWGAVIKGGMRFDVYDWIFIDLFADYTIAGFSFRRSVHDDEMENQQNCMQSGCMCSAPQQVTWHQGADGMWHHDHNHSGGSQKKQTHGSQHETKGHHNIRLNGFAIGGGLGFVF